MKIINRVNEGGSASRPIYGQSDDNSYDAARSAPRVLNRCHGIVRARESSVKTRAPQLSNNQEMFISHYCESLNSHIIDLNKVNNKGNSRFFKKGTTYVGFAISVGTTATALTGAVISIILIAPSGGGSLIPAIMSVGGAILGTGGTGVTLAKIVADELDSNRTNKKKKNLSGVINNYRPVTKKECKKSIRQAAIKIASLCQQKINMAANVDEARKIADVAVKRTLNYLGKIDSSSIDKNSYNANYAKQKFSDLLVGGMLYGIANNKTTINLLNREGRTNHVNGNSIFFPHAIAENTVDSNNNANQSTYDHVFADVDDDIVTDEFEKLLNKDDRVKKCSVM